MNRKYSEQQRESWNTDAYDTTPEVIHNIIFCNEIINDYLHNKGKYFIVAGKGTGKTLVLKYKRFLIEKSGESLLIPKDTPYLDFISDIGMLSGKLKEAYFHDYRNSKRIWMMSLMISALSYCAHSVVVDFTDIKNDIDIMRDKFNSRYSKFINLCQGKDTANPSDVFRSILDITPVSHISVFIIDYYPFIEKNFRKIHSSVSIFTDRLDQALVDIDPKAWSCCQQGMIEAAWDVMRINNHVKVYLSIRLESYSSHSSPNKVAISSNVSNIYYSEDDIKSIIDNQCKFYENGKNISSFVGFDKVENHFTRTTEENLKYIRRHTFGRPRDFVAVFEKLSSFDNVNENNFKKAVHVVSQEVANNSFDEMQFLLHSIYNKEDRENFLSEINTNILTVNELKEICRRYNNIASCDKEGNGDCKKCNKLHPFCDLYNLGLLGVIKRDIDGKEPDKNKIIFFSPYEKRLFRKGSLWHSDYYLVHSSLHEVIDEIRNLRHGKGYELINHILIGQGYEWTERDALIKESREMMKSIRNDELSKKLECLIKESIANSEDRYSITKNIREFISNNKEYAPFALNIIGLAEKISDITIKCANYIY